MKKFYLHIFIFLFPFVLLSENWTRTKIFAETPSDWNNYVEHMVCVEADYCIAVTGPGKFYKSSDQGKTWDSVYTGFIIPYGSSEPYFKRPGSIWYSTDYYHYMGYGYAGSGDGISYTYRVTPDFKNTEKYLIDSVHSPQIETTDIGWDIGRIIMVDSLLGFTKAGRVKDTILIKVYDRHADDTLTMYQVRYNYFLNVTFDGWKTYNHRDMPQKYLHAFFKIHTNKNGKTRSFGDYIWIDDSTKNVAILVEYNFYEDTWTEITTIEMTRREGAEDAFYEDYYSHLHNFQYINDTLAYAIGSNTLGSANEHEYDLFWKTTDGVNWVKMMDTLKHSAPWGFQGMRFYDARNGVIVGRYGRVLMTNDSGNTWLEIDRKQFLEGGGGGNYPFVMFVQWAGQFPIIGTRMSGNMYRYEGDFFIFDFKAPDLFFPKANTVKHNTDILFRWEELRDATSYTYQLSTDENFNNILLERSANEMNISYDELELFTNYYWRVASTNGEETMWSPTYTFRTRMPDISTLAPDCNAVEQPKDITLQWTSVKGAEQYRIRLATDPAFENILLETDGIIETEYPLTNLDNSKTYYWQVQASRSDERGDWSDVCSFTIESGVGVNDTEHSNFISIEQSKTVLTINIKDIDVLQDNITISLYTINGNLLNRLDGQLTRGTNTYEMDISAFISGAYFYNIIIDNIPVKSGVFKIVR